MDFVNLGRSMDEDEDEDEDEEEDDGENYEEPENPKKKRRKTEGDEPSSNSKYHTQTITQLDWSFTLELEEDDNIFDVPSSSPQSKKRRKSGATNVNPPKPAIQRSSRRKSVPVSSAAPGPMAPPQTPHRRAVKEIPSSESPATPPSRTSPVKGSILRERSINIPIPFNINAKSQSSPSKLPRLRVEDTFESENVSQQSRIPTTPSKRSSPAKTVRFASPEILEDVEAPRVAEKAQDARLVTSKESSMRLIDEILDSDAESDDDYEDQEDEGTSQEETCYGDIGLETQRLLETQRRPGSPCIEESQMLGENIAEELTKDGPQLVVSQVLGRKVLEPSMAEDPQFMESQGVEEIPDETLQERTQYMESQRLATQHILSMAPRTKNSDAFVSIRPENVSKIVDRTQNHEFRHQMIPETVSRIWIYEMAPTRTLKYMAVIGPAKLPGDIEIEDGIGNAEFNAKARNRCEYAWEILELYELADPLPWTTIASNEWLNAPPKRPTLLRPAVIDQLIANLKPPLFCRAPELPMSSATDTQEAEEQLFNTMIQYTQQPSVWVPSSQAIKEEDDKIDEDDEGDEDNEDEGNDDDDEEPPYSWLPTRHSTTPSHTVPTQVVKQEPQTQPRHLHSTPPSPAQGTMAPPKNHGTPFTLPELPRPSQAETVDLSQLQTPRHQSVADIVFESPTRPIFSSTPYLPTPRERVNPEQDSFIPYSISSSQLLTKSQMLPESLLNDSVPGPPPFIQDSDEDEDEL